jgi:cytochrome b6-f complex iron-sulfur subunit
MERRRFLTWVGLGFLVSSTPATLAACQSKPASTPDLQAEPLNVPAPPEVKAEVQPGAKASATTTTTTQTEPNTVAMAKGVVIGTVADLDQKGYVSGQPDFAQGKTVFVVRDPKAKQTLHAVNATCPHEQCAVDWKKDKTEFVCPCHRARFAPDGTVLKGPAKSNLTPYVATIAGDKVMVSAS